MYFSYRARSICLRFAELGEGKTRFVPNSVSQFIHDEIVERVFSGYALQSFPRYFDVRKTFGSFFSLQMVDNHSRQTIKNILIVLMQMLSEKMKNILMKNTANKESWPKTTIEVTHEMFKKNK